MESRYDEKSGSHHLTLTHNLRHLLAAALIAASADAHAFSTQGAKWANTGDQPVIWMIDPGGAPEVMDDSDLEAVRTAFNTWQSVACSFLKFQEVPWMEPRGVQADRMNQIFWITDMSQWPAGQLGTLAFTFTFYDTSNGIITDADIIANAVNWRWTTTDADVTAERVDVETVLFHEIGHFFGLNHSNIPQAVMFPSNNKGIQRAPFFDDVQAICSLYPNGEPVPDPMNPIPGGPGQVGQPCQAAQDCASSICAADPAINQAYCTAPCTPNETGTCPAGFECTAVQNDQFFCLAPLPVDELCDQCNGSAQCASGLCTTVPGANYFQPFCTRACDPTPGAAACEKDYHCEPISNLGQTGGVCSPDTGVCNPTGRGGHNEPCFSNGGCKPNHTCAEYFAGTGLNFCYLACDINRAGLPCDPSIPGLICSGIRDKPNVGACYNVAAVGRPCIPEICDDMAICAFDETLGIDTALCYQRCDGQLTCSANTQCQFFEGLGSVCVPNMGFRYLGEHCVSDAECESQTCRTYGENQLCTSVCTSTDPVSCTAGFKCLPRTGATDGLCWPLTYTNAPAEERRTITTMPVDPNYCACDTSSECNSDCDCDPECEGGGCSCRTTSSTPAIWLAIVAAGALLGRRREKFRRGT